MKILHISGANIDGGAGRRVLWVHSTLLELGINSTNSIKKVKCQNIVYMRENIESKYYNEQSVPKNYPNKSNKLFSLGLFGLDFFELEIYKNVDKYYKYQS